MRATDDAASVEARRQVTRHCGDCQLCCKLLPMQADNPGVDEVKKKMAAIGWHDPRTPMIADFNKPAGVRCQHQRHGKGCAVYNSRPFGCRYWNCRWLSGEVEGPRPDRAHYVVDVMPERIRITYDGEPPVDMAALQVWVDPNYRDAHRDKALRDYLDRTQSIAIVRYGPTEGFTLFPPSVSDDRQWHEVQSNCATLPSLYESSGR